MTVAEAASLSALGYTRLQYLSTAHCHCQCHKYTLSRCRISSSSCGKQTFGCGVYCNKI